MTALVPVTITFPDQPVRTLWVRNPGAATGRTIRDVVIWNHAGGGSGNRFLVDSIEENANCIDVAGDALVIPMPGNVGPAWTVPGAIEAGIPMPSGVNPTDDRYDLRFMVAIIRYINTTFPGARIWTAGQSSGSKMVWGLSGYNSPTGPFPELAQIRAYFHGAHGEPDTLDWNNIAGKVPKITGYWWGSAEPNPSGPGTKSFEASLADILAANGATAMPALVEIKASCCGKVLKSATAVGGITVRRFLRGVGPGPSKLGGEHSWQNCEGCREGNFARQLFTLDGYGT